MQRFDSTVAAGICSRLVEKADLIELASARVAHDLVTGTSKEVAEWSASRERRHSEAASGDRRQDGLCWAAFSEFERAARALVASAPWDGDDLAPELLDETERLKLLMEHDVSLRDPGWTIRETLDQIDEILRTMVRRIEHKALDDPKIASQWIVGQLFPYTGEGLTQLVGVDEQTLMQFAESGTRPAGLDQRRLVLVAQLIYDLLDSRDRQGILQWFQAPRHQLGDRSPIQLLAAGKIDEYGESLRSLARGNRGQLST
jgi:hypothetical protein